MVVNLPVQRQFGIIEVHLREQRILLQHEIGDGDAAKQVGLRQIAHLVAALEQEKQLHRQRMARGILVETGQKRIGIRVFKQRRGREMIGQFPRQGGLAGTDRALDHDVAVFRIKTHTGILHAGIRCSCATPAASTPATSSRTVP